MQIFRKDVGQFSLAADGNQLHRRQPQLRSLRAAAFTQRVMKCLDIPQNLQLQPFGEGFKLPDDSAQSARALPARQRIEHGGLLRFGAEAQGLKQQIVGGFVFRFDQRNDQALEHLQQLSDAQHDNLEGGIHGRRFRLCDHRDVSGLVIIPHHRCAQAAGFHSQGRRLCTGVPAGCRGLVLFLPAPRARFECGESKSRSPLNKTYSARLKT